MVSNIFRMQVLNELVAHYDVNATGGTSAGFGRHTPSTQNCPATARPSARWSLMSTP